MSSESVSDGNVLHSCLPGTGLTLKLRGIVKLNGLVAAI